LQAIDESVIIKVILLAQTGVMARIQTAIEKAVLAARPEGSIHEDQTQRRDTPALRARGLPARHIDVD
jgi:hypothetical protein